MALDNLPVWSIPHDWENGLTETLDFLTAVLASPIGSEQRFKARLSPRRTFELTFKMTRERRRLFDNLMNVASAGEFWMPVWHDVCRTTALSIITQNKFLIDTRFTDFNIAPAVFIPIGDVFNWALLEITAVDPDFLTLANTLTVNWPKGTLAYPVVRVQVVTIPKTIRVTDEVTTVTMQFRVSAKNDDAGTIELPTYKDDFVVEELPNEKDGLSYDYGNFMAELDNDTGIVARQLVADTGFNIQTHNFTALGREANAKLRSLVYALSGRCVPAWLPTFANDYEIVADAFPESTHIVISRCGYTDMGGPRPGREDIAIFMNDGTRIYRHVENSVLVGGGSNEQLTLDATLDRYVSPATVKRISNMVLNRMDSDSLELVHQTDTKGVTTLTVPFKAISSSRVVVPTPPPPPPIVTLWSSTDKGSGMALSNGDTRAANIEAGVTNSVRATVGKVSGRFYFEIKGVFISNNNTMVGLSSSAFSLRGVRLGDDANGIGASTFAAIRAHGVEVNSTFNGWGTGTAVGIAVNLDHSPRLAWFKDAAGHWNGSLTANPTTNVGGIDIDFLALPVYPTACLLSTETVDGFFSSLMNLVPPTGYTVGVHPD